jgi:hypothetical protein
MYDTYDREDGRRICLRRPDSGGSYCGQTRFGMGTEITSDPLEATCSSCEMIRKLRQLMLSTSQDQYKTEVLKENAGPEQTKEAE